MPRWRRSGSRSPATPRPLNLFENARPAADGTIAIAAPVATPGSSVTLRAEMDALLVFSACPQDMVPTNGPDLAPTDAHLRVLESVNVSPPRRPRSAIARDIMAVCLTC